MPRIVRFGCAGEDQTLEGVRVVHVCCRSGQAASVPEKRNSTKKTVGCVTVELAHRKAAPDHASGVADDDSDVAKKRRSSNAWRQSHADRQRLREEELAKTEGISVREIASSSRGTHGNELGGRPSVSARASDIEHMGRRATRCQRRLCKPNGEDNAPDRVLLDRRSDSGVVNRSFPRGAIRRELADAAGTLELRVLVLK